MSHPDGSMTPAELAAYRVKRDRERPEVDRLTQRYQAACFWLETNFDSLTHWRRFVEHTEHIIWQFRREEQALPPFEGSAFMRELCAEDPVLWADTIAVATRTMEGPAMTHGVLSLVLFYISFRLTCFLGHSQLLSCVQNWLTYRRWIAWRHQGLHEVRTPVDMGGVSALSETVSLRAEQHQHLRRERAQSSRRAARIARLRLFLVRWVLPPLREYQLFSTTIGSLLVTLGLGIWLAWHAIGPTLEAEWHQTLRAYCTTHLCGARPEETLP